MKLPRLRVHLADGDYFLRLGLESILASNADVELEEVSSNGNDAVEAATDKKPDLVLMESTISNMCSMEAGELQSRLTATNLKM